MIIDINKKTNQVKDELDKVAINMEVLETLNKLINDKLDAVRDIDLTITDKQEFYKRLYEVQRYSECYITLNYLETKAIGEINDSIRVLFNNIKRIEDLLKEITPLNDNKGVLLMTKQDKRELLDNILLNTDRIESLNDIFSEIGDDLASINPYIANKLYSLSYCIKELLKATNQKINILYPNVSDETK